jgi:hypothetical protein
MKTDRKTICGNQTLMSRRAYARYRGRAAHAGLGGKVTDSEITAAMDTGDLDRLAELLNVSICDIRVLLRESDRN